MLRSPSRSSSCTGFPSDTARRPWYSHRPPLAPRPSQAAPPSPSPRCSDESRCTGTLCNATPQSNNFRCLRGRARAVYVFQTNTRIVPEVSVSHWAGVYWSSASGESSHNTWLKPLKPTVYPLYGLYARGLIVVFQCICGRACGEEGVPGTGFKLCEDELSAG